ncbi:hypothetical protein QQ045_008759 [Rhodiola kirilowii]
MPEIYFGTMALWMDVADQAVARVKALVQELEGYSVFKFCVDAEGLALLMGMVEAQNHGLKDNEEILLLLEVIKTTTRWIIIDCQEMLGHHEAGGGGWGERSGGGLLILALQGSEFCAGDVGSGGFKCHLGGGGLGRRLGAVGAGNWRWTVC